MSFVSETRNEKEGLDDTGFHFGVGELGDGNITKVMRLRTHNVIVLKLFLAHIPKLYYAVTRSMYM